MKDVVALKKKCIQEFKTYLNSLNKGYQKSYDHILNMICFINSYELLDNKQLIAQFLLNYEQ